MNPDFKQISNLSGLAKSAALKAGKKILEALDLRRNWTYP